MSRHRICLAASRFNQRSPVASSRSGKVIIFLAILLPTLLSFCGLILDSGMLFNEHRNLQHAVDAAATAGAVDIRLQNDLSIVTQTIHDSISNDNSYADASVSVHSPPIEGPFAGNLDFLEVVATRDHETLLMHLLNNNQRQTIRARSVAGVSSTTPGAAIVVLDPDPAELSIPSSQQLLQTISGIGLVSMAVEQPILDGLLSAIPAAGELIAGIMQTSIVEESLDETARLVDSINLGITPALLPALPTLIAGLEVEGIGTLRVDGSIHVNNLWGSEDERGERVGTHQGLPYGVACMPLLSTTKVAAKHIRVVGGVDRKENYGLFDGGERSPLKAGRIAVPDPLAELPLPTVPAMSGDSPEHLVRVVLSPSGAVNVTTNALQILPLLVRSLLTPHTDHVENELQTEVVYPGVYESITLIAPVGGVRFMPGKYIIRGRNPITQISLCLVGPIDAEGVMFYIGDPDSASDSSDPPSNAVTELIPSTLITSLIPGGQLTGLDSPTDPLHGMLIFQDRNDRRPILIEAQHLLGSTNLAGTIYAKWGHLSFVGGLGVYDLRTVTGTCRFLTIGDTTLSPSTLMRQAEDVVLVE